MAYQEEEDYQKTNLNWKIWYQVAKYAFPFKKLIITLGLAMIFVAIIDSIVPMMTRYAIDHFIVPHTTKGIWVYVLTYIGIVALQAINVWFFIGIAGKLEMMVCYLIRKDGFQHLQELSFSYYDKTSTGWIMARMTSDSQKLGEILAWGFVDFVWGIAMMIAISIIMLVLNWKLALLALSVVPLLIITSLYFQKRILKNYRKVRKINSKITNSFNEAIMGARTTKTIVREKDNLAEFEEVTGSMYRSSLRAVILSSLFLPIVLSLSAIGTGLAIWYGGTLAISSAMTFGTIVAFLSYTVEFFDPARNIAGIFTELQAAQAAAERIISLIETPVEIKDDARVIEEYGDFTHPKLSTYPELKGSIEFENVTFSYNDKSVILKDFNLQVETGKSVAIVGETGSGKSTLVNLICRFYEPTSGTIKIDGEDYRSRPIHWLHTKIGYVLQTPHLFSGSIMDNIRYGNLDASDEQVIQAAKLVNAEEFIEQLPEKYLTKIGEGGSGLSTGQKQLLSFARAIVRDPSLLVLDEATSSIDTETEAIIQKALDSLLIGRTSFIIAHRLSTIRKADRILVLKDGAIIEDGNHKSLLKQKGYYYRLYSSQYFLESEEQVLSHQG